jgi:hypothetical protein
VKVKEKIIPHKNSWRKKPSYFPQQFSSFFTEGNLNNFIKENYVIFLILHFLVFLVQVIEYLLESVSGMIILSFSWIVWMSHILLMAHVNYRGMIKDVLLESILRGRGWRDRLNRKFCIEFSVYFPQDIIKMPVKL